jgi:riboflavin kinase/FMN adenylyltransferase
MTEIRLIRQWGLEELMRPTVVTFGVFDGMHIGHQKIMTTVVERARQLGVTPTVVTFDPHPRLVLRPETAPPLLQTLSQRIEIMAQMGIQQVVILPFTLDLAATPAETFLERYIFGQLDAQELYLGKGAAFGHQRRGTIELARDLARRLGRRAVEVEEVRLRGHRVSATMIRRLLKAGRVNLARRMLGRPYEITGHVVKGQGRGHELLVPTANLNVENAVLPAPGVYITLVALGQQWHRSVTNVGYRPTFGGNSVLMVEPHLLGWQGNLLGERVRLRFLHRLRSEKRFDAPEELKHQIERDCQRAARYFAYPAVHRACLTPP